MNEFSVLFCTFLCYINKGRLQYQYHISHHVIVICDFLTNVSSSINNLNAA
jgi:hypothetical protein